jgi:hypothetical protein
MAQLVASLYLRSFVPLPHLTLPDQLRDPTQMNRLL